MLSEAEELYQKTLAAHRRLNGETNFRTLQCRVFHVQILVDMGRAEAREMHAELLPVVTRVLGPDHRLTHLLLHPNFFTPRRASQ